jgi:hypothetical protein
LYCTEDLSVKLKKEYLFKIDQQVQYRYHRLLVLICLNGHIIHLPYIYNMFINLKVIHIVNPCQSFVLNYETLNHKIEYILHRWNNVK